jgi:hypothetical protein
MKKLAALLGILICSITLTISVVWGSEDEVVYDNTVNFEGNYLQDIFPAVFPLQGTKLGDLVKLEGTARYITEFQTILRGNSAEHADFSAEVRLVLRRIQLRPFEPGLLIWQSGWYTIDLLNAEDQLVSFELPSVRVPRYFTWTLEFRGFEPYLEAPAIPFYHPPVIGNSANNYFYFNFLSQSWFFQDIAGSSFYAKIWAQKDSNRGNNLVPANPDVSLDTKF